jgi:hypothetical protein
LAQLLSDPIARKHQRDFAAIVGQRKGFGFRALVLFGAICVALFVLISYIGNSGAAGDTVQLARKALARSGAVQNPAFFEKHTEYQEWLRSRGTASEQQFFDTVSQLLFRSAAGVAQGLAPREELSFFRSLYISMHFALLRMVFVLVVSWRLWAFAILLAVALEYFAIKVHEADDILGQTGNGRLYFSGIRIGLEPTNSQGAPEMQVRGLACPRSVGVTAAKKSPLGQTLASYGVANETNLNLAGIILAHAEYPTFVAAGEELSLLEAAYVGSTIAESSDVILKRVLGLHQKYRAMQIGNEKLEEFDMNTAIAQAGTLQAKASLAQYAADLERCLHRSLTPDLRTHLADLKSVELATVVLSLDAGKALAFGKEGTQWLKKSNFPHLSARAVLHSLPAYGHEYSYEERSTIRRALIFASRQSVFAPVRFPVDLSLKARAMRQWVELLMACPHELQSVTDEVELIGIISEAQRAWTQEFMDGAMALDPEVVDDTYATPSQTLFMPVQKVLALARKVIEHGTLRRLEELVARVSQKQRLESMSLDFSDDGIPTNGHAERGVLMQSDRIFPPLAHREIKTLSTDHGLTAADVRDWSSVRIVLNNFGWLARRVGDYSVPDHSLVSMVFNVDPSMPGANEFGRIGKHGLVALRGTRLEKRWGKFWPSRFISVQGGIMAETSFDFENLLKGIERKVDEDEAGISAANEGVKI